MRCPRCGNEMAESAPCPACGARVRHVRLGAEPDLTVRRVRLDTPSNVRPVTAGLPRLRREPREAPAGGRSKLPAVVAGAAGALVVGFLVFLALGNGSGPPVVPPPVAAPAGSARPGIEPPAVLPALPPGLVAAVPAAPLPVPLPPPDAGGMPVVASAPPAPPLIVGVTSSPDGGGPVTVLPIGRYGVAVSGPDAPEIPAAVQQIAAVPSTPAAAACAPTPCTPDGTGWVVADQARELLSSNPALAACWAEETVRQGHRFNVPAMASSGYFHLALAFRAMGCRPQSHGAFLSALCEGRSTVRASLLDGYREACARTGDGCDAPCNDDRYVVPEQGAAAPPPQR